MKKPAFVSALLIFVLLLCSCSIVELDNKLKGGAEKIGRAEGTETPKGPETETENPEYIIDLIKNGSLSDEGWPKECHFHTIGETVSSKADYCSMEYTIESATLYENLKEAEIPEEEKDQIMSTSMQKYCTHPVVMITVRAKNTGFEEPVIEQPDGSKTEIDVPEEEKYMVSAGPFQLVGKTGIENDPQTYYLSDKTVVEVCYFDHHGEPPEGDYFFKDYLQYRLEEGEELTYRIAYLYIEGEVPKDGLLLRIGANEMSPDYVDLGIPSGN